uniref:B30.2/SPRY domain-containing protein n=1 Tax=Xiphophorus maculatus TaxID=8083 RepID=A0A3B5PTG0_XIPMA
EESFSVCFVSTRLTGGARLAEKMGKMLDMRRVQQFAVDVTLDPDTAHPKLILTDDRKQVKHGDDWKKLPDNPERFSKCVFVLAEQSFSSGRFYFEVQVKGKTEWDLGVVRESVDRKGILAMSTKNGFWTLVLRNENQPGKAGKIVIPPYASQRLFMASLLDLYNPARRRMIHYEYPGIPNQNQSICHHGL